MITKSTSTLSQAFSKAVGKVLEKGGPYERVGEEHVHGMFPQEPEHRTQTPEPEQVEASEIGDVNRNDAVKNFQKFLPCRTLPEHH